MRQFLISPEAFLFKDKDYTPKEDEIKTVSGAVYKKMDSVIPAILTEFYSKRRSAKGDRKNVDTEAENLIKIYESRFGTY